MAPAKPLPGDPAQRPLPTRELLEGVTALPVLPHVFTLVLERLEDKRTSAKDLEKLIRRDQSLCSRVLAAANSAYYGFSRQVTTVQRATLVLGFDELRRICLGAGLGDFFSALGLKDDNEAAGLWLHSLAVAEAARLMADSLTGGQQEDAFTAGLLHDLGKVVLAARLPRAYATVRELMRRRGLSWVAAEELLGLDHQDLGLYLAEHWGLPPMLGEVMARHHQPLRELSYWPLVAVVHLADSLAHRVEGGLGWPADPAGPEPWPEVLAAFNLDGDKLGLLAQRVAARLADLNQVWPGL